MYFMLLAKRVINLLLGSCLLSVLMLLVACSGGGSNNNTEIVNSGSANDVQNPDGIWQGSITVNSVIYDDAFAVILDDYFIGYSEAAGEFLEGQLTIDGELVNGVLTQYQLSGTLVGNSSFSGSFENQSSVLLTSSTGISFTLSYNSLHQRSVSFTNLVGTWRYTESSYALTMTIRTDGSFNASDNVGCLFDGFFSIPDSNRNTYNITYDATYCGSENGTYNGLAAFGDGVSSNELVHIAVSDSNHAFAGSIEKQGGPPLIIRSTNELHTIENGDYLEFDVMGQAILSLGTPLVAVSGTLRIEWFIDAIPEPFNGPAITPVLREVSTLQLDNGIPSATTTRYLQQDIDGLKLLAVLDGAEYYWVTHEAAALNDLQGFYYLTSPVFPGNYGMANHKFLHDCDTGIVCAGTAMFVSESQSLLGNLDITTPLGRFDALRIDYDGYVDSLAMVTNTALDIRNSCDPTNANYFGSLYLFPEVGIVSLENICSAVDGTGYSIIANLSDTNIATP